MDLKNQNRDSVASGYSFVDLLVPAGNSEIHGRIQVRCTSRILPLHPITTDSVTTDYLPVAISVPAGPFGIQDCLAKTQ